jgi:hypothetical protein
MRLHEFAPLAALAGLARIAGPTIARGFGIRGIANFLNSNPEVQNTPEVQVAYNNMQKAETEEEQRQWRRDLERQFDQIYPGWRDQEITREEAPPGREKQVKALKGKVDNPWAVAWASYNKGKKKKK